MQFEYFIEISSQRSAGAAARQLTLARAGRHTDRIRTVWSMLACSYGVRQRSVRVRIRTGSPRPVHGGDIKRRKGGRLSNFCVAPCL